jgi:hypothetical protein
MWDDGSKFYQGLTFCLNHDPETLATFSNFEIKKGYEPKMLKTYNIVIGQELKQKMLITSDK